MICEDLSGQELWKAEERLHPSSVIIAVETLNHLLTGASPRIRNEALLIEPNSGASEDCPPIPPSIHHVPSTFADLFVFLPALLFASTAVKVLRRMPGLRKSVRRSRQ